MPVLLASAAQVTSDARRQAARPPRATHVDVKSDRELPKSQRADLERGGLGKM